MKYTIIMFLTSLSFCTCSQSAADSDCTFALNNVFKVHVLKIQHESLAYFYEKGKNKDSFIYRLDEGTHRNFVRVLKGISFDSGNNNDSISTVNQKGERADEKMNLRNTGR